MAWRGAGALGGRLDSKRRVISSRDERSPTGFEEIASLVSAYTGVSHSTTIARGRGSSLAEPIRSKATRRCYPDDLAMNIMLGIGSRT